MTGLLAVVLATVATTGSAAAKGKRRHATVRHVASGPAHRQAPTRVPEALPCGTVFDFQVRLDRALFSPGEIDGQLGPTLKHTIAAFQAAQNLEANGNPECNTWAALGGDTAQPSVAEYEITNADTEGPFDPEIPDDIVAQADLPALAYRSPVEAIAERFHVSPALLKKMNPGARFVAGETLRVPDVAPFDPDAKPQTSPAAPGITVQVSKADSALRLLGADGQLIFYAPVSSGSEHDPLPLGDWTVTLVKWQPEFRYNPQLFWDADPTHTKAVLKPGPNNPVGIVWIGLNLEHYGIHGTPEPNHIGHTESHGCVRLTNWDAARVAASVRKGTRVEFR